MLSTLMLFGVGLSAEPDLEVLPFCTNQMQQFMGNMCPHLAGKGSCPGNGGGLTGTSELRRVVEEAKEDHPNLEVLPFCTNQMQQFMGNMCPHLAGKGSVKGNGGGLVPAALEASPNLEVLPFCTNQMQQFMGNMCPHLAGKGSVQGNGGGLVPSAELRRILEEAKADHPNLEVLPFCTNQMQQFMGNMCPHLAGKGSVKGNGGGLVPAALEATPNLEVLPFCTNQMQQFMGNMCPHLAAKGSAPGNGGGLVPSGELRRILEEAQEDHPNLEVLPFCTNQMQQFMGNMCPHLAGKGSVKGNGGGLVPAALEATPNLEVLPFCTNQMQQFMGNMCPHLAGKGSVNGNGGGLVPASAEQRRIVQSVAASPNLEVLPFCSNQMQQFMGNLCPHLAGKGSVNGNGGGLVPSGL